MKRNPISPKVTIAALAAAVASIAVWLAEVLTGIDIPGFVEGATVVVLTFLGGYLPTDPMREDYVVDHDPNARA